MTRSEWLETASRFFSEFLIGLTTYSHVAFLTTVGVFAASFGATVWFFSPSQIAGPTGAYIATHEADDYFFATRAALRLAQDDIGAPTIVVLGTSSTGIAFGGSDDLQAHVDRVPALEGWTVEVLTTPAQTRIDALALVDTVLTKRTDRQPLIFAIGVGPHRMAGDVERQINLSEMGRLGLRSDWADEELTRIGGNAAPRTGLYLLDNFTFVSTRALNTLQNILRGRQFDNVANYADGPPVALEERSDGPILDQIRAGLDNAEGFFDFYEALRARLDRYPGVTLVLIEEAPNPDILDILDAAEAVDANHDRLDQFARSMDAFYLPYFRTAGLRAIDFHDNIHVRKGDPQERLRRSFARGMGRIVAELEGAAR